MLGLEFLSNLLIGLLLGGARANMDLIPNPFPSLLDRVLELSQDRAGGSRGTILEVGVLLAGSSSQFVDGRTLVNRLEHYVSLQRAEDF